MARSYVLEDLMQARQLALSAPPSTRSLSLPPCLFVLLTHGSSAHNILYHLERLIRLGTSNLFLLVQLAIFYLLKEELHAFYIFFSNILFYSSTFSHHLDNSSIQGLFAP